MKAKNKKIITLFVVATVLSLVLVSCGDPKYIGQWFFGRESAIKTIENLTPMLLKESGVTDNTSLEAKKMIGALEYQLMNIGENSFLQFELKDKNEISLTFSGMTIEGKYTVSKDNVLTVTANDTSLALGTFDSDYTEFIISDDFESEVGFKIYLEKKDENSHDFVYLWPEIEKGEEASLETVMDLIKDGADANYGVNNYGERLVEAAIRKNCPENVILYIIERTNPDYINEFDVYNSTALIEELSKDEDASEKIVGALMDAGADITLGSYYGYNPLQYAIRYCSEEVILTMLGRATAEQVNTTKEDSSCLMLELYKDEDASANIVATLLNAGADIMLGSYYGYNPLEYSIKYCNEDVILTMLSKATTEQVNMASDDESCLILELSKDKNASINVIAKLIDLGIDKTKGKRWGYNPIDYAKAYCSPEVYQMLINQ